MYAHRPPSVRVTLPGAVTIVIQADNGQKQQSRSPTRDWKGAQGRGEAQRTSGAGAGVVV